MDYNDNDYDGHNLHLTGEESSKISSVLRPFALPKFDFDDGLHGHLRLDSLVENEVFLGIPSQEDNQWIEDFSRGGNGIEFSSSAAESCALPRHINVWSEATSSESVEMLLKAVGQEEMVQGESKVEESDPGDQLGGSTRQMEKNLGQDDKVNDINHGSPSLLPTEGEGNILRSNQSAGVEGVHSEHTLQAQETKFSSYGVYDCSKDSSLTTTTETSNIDMKTISDKQGGTCDLVNESVSGEVQGNLPLPGTEIDYTESSSLNIAVGVKVSVDWDKVSDISFEGSSFVAKGISSTVGDQEEEFEKNDEGLNSLSVESDNRERTFSCENPSQMESSKEECSVEVCVTNFGEASDIPGRGKSVSGDEGCNEVAFVDKPAGGSQRGAVVLSSGTETKHLHEKLSVSVEGEHIEGLGIHGSDAAPINDGNSELKRPAVQPLGQHKNLVGSEDICPGNNSSLEASFATYESTVLLEVPGNLSERDGENGINPARDPGDSKDSTIAGKNCGENSGVDGTGDAGGAALTQKEIVEDGDHCHPPLIDGIQTCKKDNTSMLVTAQESDLGVSAHEQEDKKLPLDSGDMVHDDEKEVWSTFSGGVNTETTTGSQPSSPAGDYLVVNAEREDTKSSSLSIEGKELVDCHQRNPPCDTGYGDQSKETESEVPEQPRTSVSKEIVASSVLARAIEIEEIDSAVEETKIGDQTRSLVEISSVAVPDERYNESNKLMVHSANDLMVQDVGAEAAPSEKQMEEDKGKNHVTYSSIVSVTSCTIEIDRSKQAEIDRTKQAADPDTSGVDHLQSKTNKQASLERITTGNGSEVLKSSESSGVNVPSKGEGTFTFDIRPLEGQPTGEFFTGLQSCPVIQSCKLSLTGEGPPSSSSGSQTDAKILKESSRFSSSTTSVSLPSGGPTDRKARRNSSKSLKGSGKKGNQVKGTTPLRRTDKGGKSSQCLSPLGSGAGQLVTFESALRPRGAVSIPTCSLPDLNTSAPSTVFFQQPFTDLQQVQLRAQIFVYGSLIQGAAPDEACMASAFDGGRNMWEPSWRACVERLHSQKSQGKNSETPVPSYTGAKTPDLTNKQSSHQSEVNSSTTGLASNKAISSPVLNPVIPLSSPLWSISNASAEALQQSNITRSSVFDYQAVSPLNPYQTPSVRNYIGHSTGPSQAPFPVPWLASSQSSPFNIGASYPSFPFMEPLKVTPLKDSSLPITSGTQHVSSIPTMLTGATTPFSGTSSLDSRKLKVSTGQSAGTKPRKRKKSGADVLQISGTASVVGTDSAPLVANQSSKKAPAVESFNQISLIARNQADSIPTPVISSHYSTSVAVATPSSFVPKNTTNQLFSAAPPSISTDLLKRGEPSTDIRTLNIEGFSKVEEAKLHAEEAAAQAAAAINHCEGMWSLLGQQKDSGLTLEAESKLASAAVAIAAAASVAKAAAAAAKIASSAAVQAKQMADEAVTKPGTVNTTEYGAILVSNSLNLANASPISITKEWNQNNAPNFAISAVREAARRRIESASAATRHAENLDAIVEAAELAAEAVSHAGKIVTMGDPFSLSELAVAGPNSYWKGLRGAAVPGSKPDDENINKSINSNPAGVPNVYVNQHRGPDVDMLVSHVSPIQRELSGTLVDNHVTVEGNLTASVKHGEKSSKPQKGIKVSDSAKVAGVVPDPDIVARSNSIAVPSMEEGSYVEVLRDCDGSKKAWFMATVLSLKDAEALVSYTELKSDEGSEQLKEWISIEAKGGNAPKIRIPHPMTAVQFEGTRKRRRAAAKDYSWSVGDKVDAWVQDCWCEGIIAEKNKKDATTLSVHFPAQGKTSTVKVWHLRPTLIWTDGQWTEWRRSGQDGTSQGDTPVEKRVKLGSSSIETKGKEKITKNLIFDESGRNEETKLPLSANEKVFSIGSTREEKRLNMVKTMRSGLQKEGSRVVFGVPKPGKKRKFMEVSKHYVSDSSAKTNVPDDSVKLAKFLTPQGSGSRGTKNNSKRDLKEKHVAESKPKAPKSGKPPSIPSRSLTKKYSSTSSQPNARDTAVSDHASKGSISNDENESGEQNLSEFGSFSNVEEASGGTALFSSRALPQEKRKKAAMRNTKYELVNQGKLAPASGKSSKDETNEKLFSEFAEPRRSNRRIQPTSRLLEGLQSSIPSSHDKSHRSHKR